MSVYDVMNNVRKGIKKGANELRKGVKEVSKVVTKGVKIGLTPDPFDLLGKRRASADATKQVDAQNQYNKEQNTRDQIYQKDFYKFTLDKQAEFIRSNGINPMAMLGAQGATTSLRGTPEIAPPPQSGPSVMDAVGAMGSVAGSVLNLQLVSEQARSLLLDNNYKQHQMESLGLMQRSSALAAPDRQPDASKLGQSTTNIDEPTNRTQFSAPAEGGAIPNYGLVSVGGKSPGERVYNISPSDNMKELKEEDIVEKIRYHMGYLTDFITGDFANKFDLPDPAEGYIWQYKYGQFREVKPLTATQKKVIKQDKNRAKGRAIGGGRG